MLFSLNNSEARLAQLAARRSHNPKVVGSIPTLCSNAEKFIRTIGAVGSASVLCTGGPGFEPLMVHYACHKKKLLFRISLVGLG